MVKARQGKARTKLDENDMNKNKNKAQQTTTNDPTKGRTENQDLYTQTKLIKEQVRSNSKARLIGSNGRQSVQAGYDKLNWYTDNSIVICFVNVFFLKEFQKFHRFIKGNLLFKSFYTYLSFSEFSTFQVSPYDVKFGLI